MLAIWNPEGPPGLRSAAGTHTAVGPSVSYASPILRFASEANSQALRETEDVAQPIKSPAPLTAMDSMHLGGALNWRSTSHLYFALPPKVNPNPVVCSTSLSFFPATGLLLYRSPKFKFHVIAR